MPFALLIIGVWLLIAGVRNTAGPVSQPGTLFALLHGDFTGPDNFAYWFIAIVLIGAIGYIPKLKPVSVGFLTLILVVLFLKKGNSSGIGGGFFQQFLAGLNITSANAVPTGSVSQSATLAQEQAQLNRINEQILQVNGQLRPLTD